MTNSAVAQWLQEIAAAKAKAQAKATSPTAMTAQGSSPAQEHATDSGSNTNRKSNGSSQLPTTTEPGTNAADCYPRYGIIPSYNLKTRKKQLQLILPPEPVKPGPGECCGNDCDPCVNTIYWEDLARYQDHVKKLKAEYEAACKALEAGEESGDLAAATLGRIDDNRTESDDGGISVRSYRPFKVLQKRYLSENTLLVVCDVPYPKHKAKGSALQHLDVVTNAMFHILIRFQCKDQYITKAFTPVDLSNQTVERESAKVSLSGKMTFLVKLYPSPHETSDMFRQLQEFNNKSSPDIMKNGCTTEQQEGVLYLRGPIQTARDMERNRNRVLRNIDEELEEPIDTNDRDDLGGNDMRKERIVMIAAGSGITPMYQVLRAIHQQQQHQLEHQQDQQQGKHRIAKELDLIYCNRSSSEIWLRQELQEICLSTETHNTGDDDVHDRLASESSIDDHSAIDAGASFLASEGQDPRRQILTRKVLIHHVLSSCTDQEGSQRDHPSGIHQRERIYTGGRITLDLLQETLQGGIVYDKKQEYLRVLVCGPPSFNADVSSMLDQLGYRNSDSCEIHILE
ncbi:MAG: hypothetical protein J3Q66DRAFT_150480 [Benniella sp.]|nr:MAG: hypothetical protein J3Q66DRAFT_150480 [Benniella sp.]